MSLDWTTILTAALAGGGAGVVSSLAPWAQFAVEKRRERTAQRRERIAKWRWMISEHHYAGDESSMRVERTSISQHPDYQSLRPHLSEELRHRVEGRGDNLVISIDAGEYSDIERDVMEAIDQLERDWDLV